MHPRNSYSAEFYSLRIWGVLIKMAGMFGYAELVGDLPKDLLLIFVFLFYKFPHLVCTKNTLLFYI